MGYSLSWVAVKGDAEAVYAAFNLQATGRREEVPESEFSAVQLPNGRTLVIFNQKELEAEQLAAVSRIGEVVYCFVEEHVMVTDASLWRDRKQVWRVKHDGQEGVNHLSVDGDVHGAFPAIRDKYFADQAAETEKNIDLIFDIPVELARELAGFRHDEIFLSADKEPFEVLESVKKKKWWSLS
jgi:hypothetical protein